MKEKRIITGTMMLPSIIKLCNNNIHKYLADLEMIL